MTTMWWDAAWPVIWPVLAVFGCAAGLYLALSDPRPSEEVEVPDAAGGPAQDGSEPVGWFEPETDRSLRRMAWGTTFGLRYGSGPVGWFELDPPAGARPTPAPEKIGRPSSDTTPAPETNPRLVLMSIPRQHPGLRYVPGTGAHPSSIPSTIPVPDPRTPGDQSMIDKGELDMINKGVQNVTSGHSSLKIHKSVDHVTGSGTDDHDVQDQDFKIEKSSAGTQIAGRGAHLRATREYLGLPVRWLAAHLDVRERTLERWEDDLADIPAGVLSEVDELERATIDVEDGLLDWLTENPTMDVIGTFRTDADVVSAEPDCPYPASWHRALISRVVRDADQTVLQVRYVDVTNIG